MQNVSTSRVGRWWATKGAGDAVNGRVQRKKTRIEAQSVSNAKKVKDGGGG